MDRQCLKVHSEFSGILRDSRFGEDTAQESWTFDREKSRHLSEEAKDRVRQWEAMGAMYAMTINVLWGDIYDRKQKRATDGELVSQILVAASNSKYD